MRVYLARDALCDCNSCNYFGQLLDSIVIFALINIGHADRMQMPNRRSTLFVVA